MCPQARNSFSPKKIITIARSLSSTLTLGAEDKNSLIIFQRLWICQKLLSNRWHYLSHKGKKCSYHLLQEFFVLIHSSSHLIIWTASLVLYCNCYNENQPVTQKQSNYLLLVFIKEISILTNYSPKKSPTRTHNLLYTIYIYQMSL